MDVIFEQYIERLRRKRKSPHTLSAVTTAAGRLSDWLSVQGLTASTATYETLEDYFDALPLSPTSRGTHLRYVQAAYNYAIKRGLLRHNPALDIEVPRAPDTEPIIIANHELRDIRAKLWLRRDWMFFHLLVYTGMRRAEITTLTWEQVRLEEQTIKVVGKGGKLRLVPIHPALGEVLADPNYQVGKFVLRSHGYRGVCSQTVVDMTRRMHPTYTPHDYRRTVATSLARNGVDTRIIDRIMGWAPSSVRDRYYVNVATEELQRAILRLYVDDPV